MSEKAIKLDEYITAEQAGKVAGLTGRRIRQLASGPNPEIEGRKIAGRWFINRASLYMYLGREEK